MTFNNLVYRKIWDSDYINWQLAPIFFFMKIFAYPYRSAVSIRNSLYNRRIIRSEKLPSLVISIGNIAVGGTGKTPLVITMARTLKDAGYRPVVLSRGYGSKSKESVNIVSDGTKIILGHREAGDEPVLISQSLNGVPVITGSSRCKTGKRAIQEFGADILILDDGFQHRKLYRDIDIVLLDRIKPLGNGHMLPAGCLREPPEALTRADIIVLTGSSDLATSPKHSLVPAALKNHPDVFHSYHKPVTVVRGKRENEYALDYLKGKKIFAFAGIGNPLSFCRTMENLGCRLVGFSPFPDHHVFNHYDIDSIREKAIRAHAEIILTTEKDAIRLSDYEEFLQDVYTLHIESAFIPNIDAFIDRVFLKMKEAQYPKKSIGD